MSLLDFFGSGWDDPRSGQILGLAQGLLSAPGGRGLAAGIEGMNNARQDEVRRKYIQAQIAEQDAQTQERTMRATQLKAAQDAEMRKRAALPGLFGGGSAMGAGGEAQPGATPSGAEGARINYLRALEAGYTPKEITELAGLPDAGRPTVARTVEGRDANGRPVTYQFDQFGRPIGQAVEQWKAPVLVNQGDRQTFVDPTTMEQRGAFGVNMSPGERDASARGWASNAIARDRLAMDRADIGPGGAKAPSGYRWGADGGLVAIPGGPAEKGNAATEGERKAATLLQRLEGSQTQYLKALSDDRSAAKPGLLTNGLRAVGAESLANTVTGEARQRAEAAQLDMLDAALTLGTGAAYTREQLEGYRKSYFPQIGDDPKTIAEKKDRLDNVIEGARIAAGRAAGSTRSGGATGSWEASPQAPRPPMRGQVIQGYKFKGGNPADQANWEKQ